MSKITQLQQDWLATTSEPFARFPIQVLSLKLTKVQLSVYLVIISKCRLDGTTHPGYPFCYVTICELLDMWTNRKKRIPDTSSVSEAVTVLEQKGLLQVTNSGINKANHYRLLLPSDLKSFPVTDKTTPEYLALQEEKRAKAREYYHKRNASSKPEAQAYEGINNLAPDFDLFIPPSDDDLDGLEAPSETTLSSLDFEDFDDDVDLNPPVPILVAPVAIPVFNFDDLPDEMNIKAWAGFSDADEPHPYDFE